MGKGVLLRRGVGSILRVVTDLAGCFLLFGLVSS
jgi:hypothetical protein